MVGEFLSQEVATIQGASLNPARPLQIIICRGWCEIYYREEHTRRHQTDRISLPLVSSAFGVANAAFLARESCVCAASGSPLTRTA